LKFTCRLDKNQQSHRDLYSSIKRGDINECSFAFAVDGEDGDDFSTSKDAQGRSFSCRTVKRAKLFDVSAVTHPAYGGTATAVSARSADYLVGGDAHYASQGGYISRLFPELRKGQSLQDLYFEQTGKEWISTEHLRFKAAMQSVRIRLDARSLKREPTAIEALHAGIGMSPLQWEK
jgi:hypothetical protein